MKWWDSERPHSSRSLHGESFGREEKVEGTVSALPVRQRLAQEEDIGMHPRETCPVQQQQQQLPYAVLDEDHRPKNVRRS